jgi:hypothetical protein
LPRLSLLRLLLVLLVLLLLLLPDADPCLCEP